MKKVIVLLFSWFLCLNIVYSQNSELAAGPMLGYNTMKEVAIWVQSDTEDTISIQYRSISDSTLYSTTSDYHLTKNNAYTQTIPLMFLEPGNTYEYQIIVNNKLTPEKYQFTTQAIWKHRGNPPEFSFLLGSCFYLNEEKYDRPDTPYGGGYEIVNSMSSENTDFMIWLGDNIYLREPDWNSRSGIYHRYSHMRKLPELQPLLSGMHHYAIWDDHDYGPNNSIWSYRNKKITREAFNDFWANPNSGLGESEGITGTFIWNDCQFFLMDNRWYRTPHGKYGKMLGDIQLKWLIDALRSSDASFKFICVGSQVISDLKKYENYARFTREREKLITLIDHYEIENVIFLTGDRHHSEISKLTTESGIDLYDITCSPLTSRSYDHSSENNTNRVAATIGDRNYSVVEIKGDKNNRKCIITFKETNGDIIYDFTINQSER